MPTIQLTASPSNLIQYDRLFLFNEAIDDASIETVPFPLTYNASVPDWLRMNFFCCASAFDGVTDRVTQSFPSCGGTLISPSYVFMANHCKPTRLWFKQADGTEVMRDRIAFVNIEGDLAVAKLSSPITTIDPAAILLDSSKAAGCNAIAAEADRSLVVYEAESSLNNTASGVTYYRYNAGDTPEVAFETYDSGHPFVIYFDQTPAVVMTGLFGAGSIGSGPGTDYTGSGPNASHYIDEINAILADESEELTLLDVTLVGPGGRTPAFSPLSSPLNIPLALRA